MRGGALTQLVTAFSRDQEAKVYVTHRLREHGADVWHLLQQVFTPSLLAALRPTMIWPLNPSCLWSHTLLSCRVQCALQVPGLHVTRAGLLLLQHSACCAGFDQVERRTAAMSAYEGCSPRCRRAP